MGSSSVDEPRHKIFRVEKFGAKNDLYPCLDELYLTRTTIVI